ncbi:glycoside hydrolase family 15 protein [Pseudomonas kuykendallii]|uniref:glycoside hydrolase family 15 protein n=1 Tax=Pseudomonas kuykendallii TaxID=1007099 RepID=UPI0028D1F4DC|nr:glycoside hydrolase family 15 protein [Pseudomonas kuykendallii]
MDEALMQRPIEAHGIIGDMQTAALIADDGCVDFLCWPNFDSPTIFASLLDSPKAGAFEIAPDIPSPRHQQIYLPDSNILQTRWLGETAIAEVTDFMPVDNHQGSPRLIRQVNAVRGEIRFTMRCAVRHDYGRADTRAEADGADVCFHAAGQPTLRLAATCSLAIEDGAASAEFILAEGESVQLLLSDASDRRMNADDAQHCQQETLSFWRDWVHRSNYRGRWREAVERSALALKLLTSRRHGAILAAATFGLPETPGGSRNWDYRYTWVRDASFTVYAFMRLGYVDEANDFMRWVGKRVSECKRGELRIVYRADGERELTEESLPHFAGHGGATPVLIGNDAYGQVQLDIYGELLDAIYLANKYGEAVPHDEWQHITRLVDHVCERWQQPDVGIWEMRGEAQHFLHSRVMCWVAVDRAIRLASKRSLPAPFRQWDETRRAIHEDIWSNFWNEERGHFVQRLGSAALDGAMLMMPLVRFVSATDPRWLATLDAIGASLVRDGMVKRYLPSETPSDTLEGEEGAFAACSFWYVECLARAGRVAEAHLEFEKLLSYANQLGLYAEEFDGRAHHLGNMPQALTHLALISAATFLDRKLDKRATLWQP